MVVRSVSSPSMPATMLSPRCTAPTPAGVPVKIRSPACSSNSVDELGHDLGHAPDQLGQVGVLSRLTVDLEPDATRREVTTVRHGTDRRNRGRVIERLGDVPGQAMVLRLRLQVATRQVIADRVTEHVLERLGRRDLLAALADRDDEFHLVVQVRRARRVTHRRAVRDHCVGRLGEEARRLARRIRSHLARVRSVIAPDAVDAVHGETHGGA